MALTLARGAADAVVAANKSVRTLAAETVRTLPRLARLGQINDHTRISLGRIIDEQAHDSPHGEFLLFDGRVHTYEAVNRRINNVVRGLIEVGVRQGDHVGVLMETRPSALVAIAALSRLGAVAVLMQPDSDLVAEARIGGVSEIIADPTNLDTARQLPGHVLVLGGGESRDLHLPEDADVIDMEKIDPDAVELPAWYRQNPGLARDLAFIGFTTTASGELVAKQITNYRWALSAFGTASTAALGQGDTVYCLTPLHHESGLLVSLGGAVVAAPVSRCRAGCARTGSSPRSGSTGSPWCPIPGRCCARLSTTGHLPCTATTLCGCSSARGCQRACGSASSTPSPRPRRRVLRHHRWAGRAGQRFRCQDRQQRPPAAGRRAR
ncbi:AMP-binding enzyme family protein [Mycobacterium xenopi 4042]|uniref:AMP-binding enzyme family protein n=1 Tax=Mycobacterium xenopi 4042 TaxID=1299334 RepID=X8DF55_MYCXE|nr:AMP-binding enzyme family protein [Mycobacterium xenopi 4042]